MNPLIVFVVLAVAVLSWSLITSMRAGVFKFGNGSYGRTTGSVRRDTDPTAFWLLVAFQAGVILYVASFVFEL